MYQLSYEDKSLRSRSSSSSPFSERSVGSNIYAEYLCQAVFSDMSVLPLVFPSNISCFSSGSYKEELTHKRELPVPPLPKRSGIWAKSNEDIQGLSSGSVSPVSSDSNSSNIARFTSDTCLPRSVFRTEPGRHEMLTAAPGSCPSPHPEHVTSRDVLVSRDATEESRDSESVPAHVGSPIPADWAPILVGRSISPTTPELELSEQIQPGQLLLDLYRGGEDTVPVNRADYAVGEDSASKLSDSTEEIISLPNSLLSYFDFSPCVPRGLDSILQGEQSGPEVHRQPVYSGVLLDHFSANSNVVDHTAERVDSAADQHTAERVESSADQHTAERRKLFKSTEFFTETNLSDQRFLGSQLDLEETLKPVCREPSPCVLSENSTADTADTTDTAGSLHSLRASSEKLNMFKKSDKGEKKTGGEIFRAALERLSFRSSKKKKKNRYELKVEPNAAVSAADAVTSDPNLPAEVKSEASHDVGSGSGGLVAPVAVEPIRSVANKPPLPPGRRRPPVSASWEQSRPIGQLDSALRQFKAATAQSRENLNLSKPDLSAIEAEVARTFSGHVQRVPARTAPTAPPTLKVRLVAPPTNAYVETEWEKLSASMASLNNYRKERCELASDIARGREGVKGSTQSLMQGEEEEVCTAPLPRTQSVTVLNHVTSRNTNSQIPENRFRELTPHQARIKDSMERLNIPSWYSNRSEGVDSTPAPPTSRRAAGGWRRHVTNSRSSTPATAPESEHSRARWSSKTLPLSYRTSSISSLTSSPSSPSPPSPPASTLTRQPYLGWRSQERLDIGPVYLATPAQRLASTALPVAFPPPARANTLPPSARLALSKNIKQVSEEIQDYCKNENETWTPSSSSSSPSQTSASPSPPLKPLEAWTDTPLHQNGRGHLVLA